MRLPPEALAARGCAPGRGAPDVIIMTASGPPGRGFATSTPGEQNVTVPAGLPGWRRWLAVTGLALALAKQAKGRK